MILRGKATGRVDDNPETIKKRLQVYAEQTYPVKSFYKKLNKYVAVDGLGKIEDIFAHICIEIEKAI